VNALANVLKATGGIVDGEVEVAATFVPEPELSPHETKQASNAINKKAIAREECSKPLLRFHMAKVDRN